MSFKAKRLRHRKLRERIEISALKGLYDLGPRAVPKRIRIHRGDLRMPEPKVYHYLCENERQAQSHSALVGALRRRPHCALEIRTRAISMEYADDHIREAGWHVTVHSRPIPDNEKTVTREVYCPACAKELDQSIDELFDFPDANGYEDPPIRDNFTRPQEPPSRDTIVTALRVFYATATEEERHALRNPGNRPIELLGVQFTEPEYMQLLAEAVAGLTPEDLARATRGE